MQNLDVSTVVFAVVAIFVIFKLRSVLGTRTGAERRPLDPTTPARGDPPVAGERSGIRATFGMTGKWAQANPDLVRRMAADGDQLMNHTWDHRSFTGLSTRTRAPGSSIARARR